MKFKLFSVVLLLVCFVFLGVLTGLIPVSDPDASPAAALLAASAPPTATAVPTPTVTPIIPTARTAATARPQSTASAAEEPSAPPVSPTAGPTASAAPTAVPTATAAPSASAIPTPTAAAEPQLHLWEPEAQVVSTTITWSDPIQNETDYAIDGKALLAQPLDISLPRSGTQILIIHTHGTEAFTPDGEDQYEASADYRTTDTDHTIIQVGLALGRALQSHGLRVLVDTELYDWPSYNGSYSRSEAAVKRYLEAEPDIAMVIDLHRDALGDDELMYQPVSDQLEQEAAQIMFVMGTDADLDHPHWRDNLSLAASLQALAEEQYPHLMRPIMVSPYRYNQQLTRGSVLLEIGAAGNTLAQAVTAAELFADAIGPALAQRIGA